MTETLEIDWDDAPQVAHKFALHHHQTEWLAAIERDFESKSRILVVAAGGTGKTTVFAAMALRFNKKGIKTLVLENRDRLTRQTADRIRNETGLDVDIEMGDEHASPFAPVVVASVQTLGRVNRLTGFSDSHFGLVVADECHLALASQWQRVLCYFHYGAHSLAEDWKRPPDGSYEPKAKCAGFTATPDIGERKNLGEFFHHRSVNYSYLEAVQDGWLVGPVQKNIPVRIDLSKYKAKSTPNGNDFAAADLSAALIPIIEELAEQVKLEAGNRKTIAFLPSVECARMMTDALLRRGMRAIFVSGECLDASEKTDEFAALGAGSVLVNCCLYVYGVDFPDVDCIAWFRATISKAFYIQGIYRGTRVLPGILNGLKTAEKRREAIALSKKPSLLILDPLFVSDRIDLLDAYDLLTDEPRVKAAMKASGELSVESAQQAERDFLKSLKKEAKKHERKASRTIDPLAFAVSLGDMAIRSYEPKEAWESQPPSIGQLDFIKRQGMDITGITSKGLASRIISRLRVRQDNKLASPRQLKLMHNLGLDEQTCATLTITEATATIDRMLQMKRDRGGLVPMVA
jgi:hypothetical protein